jgi:trehalose synthase
MAADLQPMAVGRGSLAAHAPVAGADAVERVHAAARPLRGVRVLHVTSAGGGRRVAEGLGALLPLAADAGLRVQWRVLFGDGDVGRQLRDGLQGAETAISDEDFEAYRGQCAGAAQSLPAHDLLVLHDPGALGLAEASERPVVWHCHVDAGHAEAAAWDRARPLAEACAARVVPAEGFAPGGLEAEAIAPGIDPLSVRNADASPWLVGRVGRSLGLDLDRPMACQVMSLDRWKDPHETLEAFALAREELPDLQLALVTDLGDDWPALKELTDLAGEQEGVLVLTSYTGVGQLELGAVQRLARVSLHRALREGYGLAASEALWKNTPVIGGPDGGVPLQVRDGIDGYVTAGPQSTAERLVELVVDPGAAVEMGRAGREHVRERHLVTRALEGELGVLANTLGA